MNKSLPPAAWSAPFYRVLESLLRHWLYKISTSLMNLSPMSIVFQEAGRKPGLSPVTGVIRGQEEPAMGHHVPLIERVMCRPTAVHLG